MNKIYFPNLNGLRFIAAVLVIIHHLEQIKRILHLQNYWSSPFVRHIGSLGVTMFFVLSGFLITYLLLEEEKQTNSISVKNFYIRRVLRIWPLYYLIVIISFFVVSQISFFDVGNSHKFLFDDIGLKLFLFLVFLPNLSNILFPPVSYAAQTWSVGVEEQFYVIWPILIKFFKRKEMLLYGVILFYLFMNLIGFPYIKTNLFWNKTLNILMMFWINFRIDCMAIGGLFAVILFKKQHILNILFNNYFQITYCSALVILIGLGIEIPYINHEFYAILFGMLIINLAGNKNTIINLETKAFNFLGQISYGLYMYHAIGIAVALKLLILAGLNYFILQYFLSLLITISISTISYYYFEKYFIGLKTKFSKIVSGDNARND